MSDLILKVENISKQYRLGLVGSGTFRDDLKRFVARVRGKEDPFLKVGAVNDRSQTSNNDYVWALRDINFEVKRGEVLGIIGKNGAGKSTLLKLLSRITAPTTGSIKSKGRIASLLEVGTGFNPELTGRENIYLNGAILGMTKAEITSKLDEIIAFSGCERYIDTPTKRYSSGMTVRLAFAVAAHLEPEILVVDEVLAVGDAEFQKKAIGKMQDISKGEGRTVLFVSHNMSSVQHLCTRGLLLENGTVKDQGKVSDVIEKYLNVKEKTNSKKVIFTESYRKGELSKEVELISIELKTEEPTVRGAVDFEIEIRKNKEITSAVSLTGSICANTDERVGSFFTSTGPLNEDGCILQLSLNSHNLSVGSYYLNIAISTGNVIDGNLKMIDHAYNAIGFDILKEKESGRFLTEWKPNWGKIFFPSTLNIK